MVIQVNFLREHGISAAALMEDTTVSEIKAMGHISVLFTSPEAAVLNEWRQVLKSDFSGKICVLVFDEAHCISSWGQDFRPAYRDVPIIQSYLDASNLVLTATANLKIQEDIYKLLGMDHTKVKVVSVLPDRPNIFLDIRESKENFEEELSWLLDLLREGIQKKKILVYVNSINKCYQIFLWLTTSLLERSFTGEPSPETRRLEMYHSSADADSKKRIIDDFVKADGRIELLVSTVAFGMGVNVPNIDIVVHWGPQHLLYDIGKRLGDAVRMTGPPMPCVTPSRGALTDLTIPS